MNDPKQSALEASKQLGNAVESYLEHALNKHTADECRDCSVERVETEKGLIISRIGGIITAHAYRTPVDGFESPDISFQIRWKDGLSELPEVNMHLISDGELAPREVNIEDYFWIVKLLSSQIEPPRLRLVQ